VIKTPYKILFALSISVNINILFFFSFHENHKRLKICLFYAKFMKNIEIYKFWMFLDVFGFSLCKLKVEKYFFLVCLTKK